MIFQNFYIKAKVEILQVPLPLVAFKKPEDGYYTIPEYLATFNHTVERFSSDGYFIKGFGFSLAGLDELRERFTDFDLELGVNVFILSPNEVREELAKPKWNNEEEI